APLHEVARYAVVGELGLLREKLEPALLVPPSQRTDGRPDDGIADCGEAGRRRRLHLVPPTISLAWIDLYPLFPRPTRMRPNPNGFLEQRQRLEPKPRTLWGR